jgi:hypothetical protein
VSSVVARTLVVGGFDRIGFDLRIYPKIVRARLPTQNALWAKVVVGILRLPVRAGVGKRVVAMLNRVPERRLRGIIFRRFGNTPRECVLLLSTGTEYKKQREGKRVQQTHNWKRASELKKEGESFSNLAHKNQNVNE